jgi:hypothetical protein
MKILSIIDAFNVIARVDGILHSALNFRHSKNGKRKLTWEPGLTEFRVSRMGQHSGADCDRMLARYHIDSHGKRVTSDEFIFSVPSHKAKFAAYILARGGVATTAAPTVGVSEAAQTAGLPPTWAEQRKAQAQGGGIRGILRGWL